MYLDWREFASLNKRLWVGNPSTGTHLFVAVTVLQRAPVTGLCWPSGSSLLRNTHATLCKRHLEMILFSKASRINSWRLSRDSLCILQKCAFSMLTPLNIAGCPNLLSTCWQASQLHTWIVLLAYMICPAPLTTPLMGVVATLNDFRPPARSNYG